MAVARALSVDLARLSVLLLVWAPPVEAQDVGWFPAESERQAPIDSALQKGLEAEGVLVREAARADCATASCAADMARGLGLRCGVW